MPIERSDFDEISPEDLRELKDLSIPEGLRIEYKSALYGSTNEDRKEALKDISSFANTSGGHLVIGIEEEDGFPVSIEGLSGINPDGEMQRLEQLIQSGIQPRVIGIRIRTIRLDNGNHVIVLRIPKSWNSPHRVCLRNSNRFYLRNSSGVHEASIEELRNLFVGSMDMEARIRDFREKRLQAFESGQLPLEAKNEGQVFVHFVPRASVTSIFQIDLESAHQCVSEFQPIASPFGQSSRFNFDGLLTFGCGDPSTGYTQVFRNGMIEVASGLLINRERQAKFIHAKLLVDVLKAIPRFIEGMKKVGIPLPVIIMITLNGVQEARLDSGNPIDRDRLRLPEIEISQFGSRKDYMRFVKPAFDALWNAAGYLSCNWYNDQGEFNT